MSTSTTDQQQDLRSWTFDLPITRPLSMNDRAHWRVKAKQTKHVRTAAATWAQALRIPPLRRVAVEVHYAPRDSRKRDAINLAPTIKATEDGIVDAGVVPDDDGRYVEPTHGVIDPPTRGTGRLYVVVRELAS